MTTFIETAQIERLIDFTNVEIETNSKERTTVVALRRNRNASFYPKSYNERARLFQGQVIARRYESLGGIRVPQSLVLKTLGPLRKVITWVFIPALPNALEQLCDMPAEQFVRMMSGRNFPQMISDGMTEAYSLKPHLGKKNKETNPAVVSRMIDQTLFPMFLTAGLTWSCMGQITDEMSKLITNCETRPEWKRKRTVATLSEIADNAANFRRQIVEQVLPKWASGEKDALSELSIGFAFHKAHNRFFTARAGARFVCPAHSPLVGGMLGEHFTSVMRLANRVQELGPRLQSAQDRFHERAMTYWRLSQKARKQLRDWDGRFIPTFEGPL